MNHQRGSRYMNDQIVAKINAAEAEITGPMDRLAYETLYRFYGVVEEGMTMLDDIIFGASAPVSSGALPFDQVMNVFVALSDFSRTYAEFLLAQMVARVAEATGLTPDQIEEACGA